MSNVALKLQSFEGPLDLLLHLIEREKIDIYDIPIVTVTEQYMEYLRQMSEFDMDTASEFLVMAATLLQIKSRMLLPKQETEDEEEIDPRQQLMEMLVEYRKIKKAAGQLAEYKLAADKFFQRTPMFANIVEKNLEPGVIGDLLKAYAAMRPAIRNDEAYIEPQAFSVQEKMANIMQLLQKQPNGFLWSDLFQTNMSGERVAVFLGILELLKMGLIDIAQKEQFAPIYILASHSEAAKDYDFTMQED